MVYKELLSLCLQHKASLIAVSKKQSIAKIRELYAHGQRDFAENYVQELLNKAPQLPTDIRWHFIGHLQSNKIKQLIPIVSCIQSVDSIELYYKIAQQNSHMTKQLLILFQVHIAQEEHKFGFAPEQLLSEFANLKYYPSLKIGGVMGMASLTKDKEQIASEFKKLYQLFIKLKTNYQHSHPDFNICSMGMSSDYSIALNNGSNMLRIGSLLFGERS